MWEALKGWKTFGAAIAVGALGAAQTFLQSGGGDLIPPAYVGPVLIGIGVAMAYLRSQTDTPPGQK